MGTLILKALKPLRHGWRRFEYGPATSLGAWFQAHPGAWVVLGLALSMSTLTICWLRAEPLSAPVRRFEAPRALQGWTITQPEGGVEALAQSIGETGLILLTAGQAFTLDPNPVAWTGRLTLENSDAWDHAGGEFGPAAAGGGAHLGRAPAQPGRYRLVWNDPATARQGALELLVLEPAAVRESAGNTTLTVCGEPIGPYLDPLKSPSEDVRKYAALYRPPTLFAIINAQTETLPLDEGLQLGQLVAFLDERAPDGRKIQTNRRHTDRTPVIPALVHKLTALRQRLREQGHTVTRFYITSGFRTPAFNKQIGGAAFSRHCYGDAVDLCIDEDGDLKIDDLNGDGRGDELDGLIIAQAAEDLEREGRVAAGGIGLYHWPGEHSVGSHVHVDCRGFTARWGQRYRNGKKEGFTWWRDTNAVGSSD
ncbi:MAG: hypothetical protein HS116_20750 [Planctomycetes bacterium]|nr:hypothetical protein [Planctomycetota bacterium]